MGRDPRIATTDGIEALVRAHGVPEAKVWMVCDRVASARLDPTQVWAWAMAFDGTELAHLCGSPLSDVEVATHVAEQTLERRAFNIGFSA